VTHADTALLASLGTDDTTISALAHHCRVTQQAASQQLAPLENKGYVTARPTRGTAGLSWSGRPAAGTLCCATRWRQSSAPKDQYAAHLGADRLAALKGLPTDLLAYADAGGTLGGD